MNDWPDCYVAVFLASSQPARKIAPPMNSRRTSMFTLSFNKPVSSPIGRMIIPMSCRRRPKIVDTGEVYR